MIDALLLFLGATLQRLVMFGTCAKARTCVVFSRHINCSDAYSSLLACCHLTYFSVDIRVSKNIRIYKVKIPGISSKIRKLQRRTKVLRRCIIPTELLVEYSVRVEDDQSAMGISCFFFFHLNALQ